MGFLVLVVPHAIGAPVAIGERPVPSELIHRFEVLSILTTGTFWIALGSIGGYFTGVPNMPKCSKASF
jgi:predicted cobalt transporter CbtA